MKNTPELLLAETAWLQALARRLVSDGDLAQDLVQETWLDALRNPPGQAGPVRGWLATVLRNNVASRKRRDANRGARERDVSRDEALPSTADLVERASTHRDVVQAVLDLNEPYRTVLLARFYEGLRYVEIAKRTGSTRATVNSQITRGLQQLRSRLENKYGDPKSLALALIPLTQEAAGRTISPLLLGGTLIGALALTGALVLKIWNPFATRPQVEATPAVEVALETGDPESRPLESHGIPERHSASASVATQPGVEPPVKQPSAPAPVESRLRGSLVIDSDVEFVTLSGGPATLTIRGIASAREIQVDAVVLADLYVSGFADHVELEAQGPSSNLRVLPAEFERSVALEIRLPIELSWIVEAGTGDIVVEQPCPHLRVDSGNGDVSLRGGELGSIQIKAGTGTVRVDAETVATLLDVDAGGGDVLVALEHSASRGRVLLTSASGQVELMVPYDVVGRFAVQAARGTIDIPAPLGLIEENGIHKATVGQGGGAFELTTDRGSVRIGLR